MQYSVHRPSQFISNHLDSLLPEWSRPVASVLVVLQQSACDLLEKTSTTENQKQQLRRQFLDFGWQVAGRLQRLGHLADLFDPATGLPLLSQPGQLWLDDVAVVQACLGYPSTCACGCSVLIHPLWGSAVYPSTLVSSAQPDLMAQIVSELGKWEDEEMFNAGRYLIFERESLRFKDEGMGQEQSRGAQNATSLVRIAVV